MTILRNETKLAITALVRLSVPMLYTENFRDIKLKTFNIFLIFAQNIDLGYMLELLR